MGLGNFLGSLFGLGSSSSVGDALADKAGSSFDFGELIGDIAPSLITGGAALLQQGLQPEGEKPLTQEEKEAAARRAAEMNLEFALKAKQAGLTGGGGGGGSRYQPVDAGPLVKAASDNVSAKLAQASLMKELSDQLSGRMNQAILSRRR